MGEVTFSHKSIDYPYLSKSAITMYKTCKFKFYLTYIEGLQYKPSIYMDWGSYMHNVYYKFFDEISAKRVLDYAATPTMSKRIKSLPLYDYLYSVLLRSADEKVTRTAWFTNAAEGFLEFQTLRALEVTTKYATETALRKYFIPTEREKFLREDNLMIYGTIDSLVYDYEPEKPIINDYKNTVHITESLIKTPRTNGYIKRLGSRYVREGNFYVLLHALTEGGFELEKGISPNLKKDGEVVNIANYYDYSYLFLPLRESGVKHVFARKKASTRSIRSILSLLDEIRTQTIFERVDNPNICQWCPLYEEVCKGHVPKADRFLQHLL